MSLDGGTVEELLNRCPLVAERRVLVREEERTRIEESVHVVCSYLEDPRSIHTRCVACIRAVLGEEAAVAQLNRRLGFERVALAKDDRCLHAVAESVDRELEATEASLVEYVDQRILRVPEK